MNDWKFLNHQQPPTLVNATILCYIDAVFGLIGGRGGLIVIVVALGLGGFGIANDKRWGYFLAVIAAAVQLVLLVTVFGASVLSFPLILTLMFDVALVVLLVHPMSRDYQRIWFH